MCEEAEQAAPRGRSSANAPAPNPAGQGARSQLLELLGLCRSKAGVVSPTPGRTVPTQGSARPPPRPMLPAVRPATAPVSSVSSKDLPRYRPTSRDGFRGAGQALETV